VKPKKIGETDISRDKSEEAMANITILSFDKDGMLEGPLPVVGPEITDVVLIAHGWNETPEGARDHYQHVVDPLEAILSQNTARWQGHMVAYFGVIWPSAKYADDRDQHASRLPRSPAARWNYIPAFERRGSGSARSGRGAVSRD
jgi:hypothetical protein